jgi:arsenate reductase
MAAAWFNRLSNPAKARAISAGTQPSAHVHGEVVEVMKEVGIDLSDAATRRLTPTLAAGVQMLITMGCAEQCPYIAGVTRDDWPLRPRTSTRIFNTGFEPAPLRPKTDALSR